jgi:hypothetical protein
MPFTFVIGIDGPPNGPAVFIPMRRSELRATRRADDLGASGLCRLVQQGGTHA